jgi:hypothetical protein
MIAPMAAQSWLPSFVRMGMECEREPLRMIMSGLLASGLCLMSVAVLAAQEPNCREILAMAKMTHATNLAEIAVENEKAGHSYRAQVVLAARSFELRPEDKSDALALLNLIPQDDGQHTTWVTMGDSLCDDETVPEMKSMERLGKHLPRDLAKAVLLVPAKMPSYVGYASTSLGDPHSDYAVQMEAVCRANHQEFLNAVEALPADKREWFVKHVLNPGGCHALALPEAE